MYNKYHNAYYFVVACLASFIHMETLCFKLGILKTIIDRRVLEEHLLGICCL